MTESETGVATPPWRGQVYYLLGGTMPAQYRDWVARDLTGPHWRLRQAVRPALLVLPFAIVFALLPGDIGVRLTIAVCLLVAGVALGLFTSGHFRNRRLVQHGLPPVLPGPGPEDDL